MAGWIGRTLAGSGRPTGGLDRALEAGYHVFRDLVYTPAFMAMLPAVDGRFGLDLGCGEGHNTRPLVRAGAEVVALDTSRPFIEAAASKLATDPVHPRRRRDPAVRRRELRLRHRLHELDGLIADPETTLREVAVVLKTPRGSRKFSIVHPMTSTQGEMDPRILCAVLADGDRRLLLDDPVTETWTFGAAPEEIQRALRISPMHAARGGLVGGVRGAGFVIDAGIGEPCADDARRDHPEVADTRIVPVPLHSPRPERTDFEPPRTRRHPVVPSGGKVRRVRTSIFARVARRPGAVGALPAAE